MLALGRALMGPPSLLPAALRVAGYAYVLETGSIVLEGRAAEVAHAERVVDTYLGRGQRDRHSGCGSPAA